MLTSESVELGPFERGDLSRWREWVNDWETATFLDRIIPVGEVATDAFYERAVVNNPDAIWFSVRRRSDGAHVGNVWLWNINQRHRNAEVRILIGERSAWGSGIGTEALRLLTAYAHGSANLHKVYAYVMERNPRARAAFERAGFTLEATFEREFFWDGAYENASRLVHFGTTQE